MEGDMLGRLFGVPVIESSSVPEGTIFLLYPPELVVTVEKSRPEFLEEYPDRPYFDRMYFPKYEISASGGPVMVGKVLGWRPKPWKTRKPGRRLKYNQTY